MHQPGWYQDAAVPGQERWWDGSSFTTFTRPAGAPPLAPPVLTQDGAPSMSGRQQSSRVDLSNGKNRHATVGLVGALISLLGSPVACVVGLIFGVLGLERAGLYAAAGHPPIGRTKSIWALALTGVGTVVTVLSFVLL